MLKLPGPSRRYRLGEHPWYPYAIAPLVANRRGTRTTAHSTPSRRFAPVSRIEHSELAKSANEHFYRKSDLQDAQHGAE